ncbi:Panacea domain-containing protein [Flavobacterium sp. AG291]|uniref:Panacea domain-containing protein n=1 Tax=Flavobacterium sp. AG291 TaxID=2184000 RepID=UPI000E0BC957|nr:type II toxin-antitoxin system antitoxin SocA domain-containing protein [Flavobacterium sp. AG291]
MHNALYIADCLIDLASQNPDNNDMTNMKLQKLLYYVQGTYLALHGSRMFEQGIKKWQYGPVVPDVYHAFKDRGNQTINFDQLIDTSGLNDNEKDVIKMVYDYFGQFSAIALMNFTHNESPWNSVEMSEEITDDLLLEYFKTIVIKEDGEE